MRKLKTTNMGTPLTPEKLYLLRRLRKARRLTKKVPLFAFQMMKEEHPDYTYEEYCADLRRRSKPKPKRKGKSPLMRYGRYWRIQKLVKEFHAKGNHDCIRRANILRQNITKRYKIRYSINKEGAEYSFSALIPIERIETLVHSINQCKTAEEAEALILSFK